MSTDLVTIPAPIVQRFDEPEMIRTLQETVCKGATNSQFRMFVEICKATGLNPFLKEIWFVPGVGVIAGRDGYLRVANEHPQFDGMETLVERDEAGIPIKATCKVWRKDRAHPITCEAYYNEYRKSSAVWTTYKSAMISKVAEVLALKRSFSINGVVTEEEIGEQKANELGSKEAAQEVAKRKIAEMKARVEEPLGVSEADIIEAQPEELSELAQQLADSIAQVQESRGAKKPDKFAALKNFRELKHKIIADTGSDQVYYVGLESAGYRKSNEIPADDLRRSYKLVVKGFTEWKAAQPPITPGSIEGRKLQKETA